MDRLYNYTKDYIITQRTIELHKGLYESMFYNNSLNSSTFNDSLAVAKLN